MLYCNRKAFVCPQCGQYNGFKEDGDYDRFIPEQRYEYLNPTPQRKVFHIPITVFEDW